MNVGNIWSRAAVVVGVAASLVGGCQKTPPVKDGAASVPGTTGADVPAKTSATARQVSAPEWPQWRGPSRNDHSPDRGLMKSWPEGGPKRLWMFENAGLGYAGYSIAGDKVFTMGLREQQEYVIAINATTGAEAWATPAGERYPNDWGDGPRMTPTVNADRVYGLGAQGLLVCLNARDGSKIWEKHLVKELGGKLQTWGYSESPLVVDDLVIVTPGGSDGTLAALDKKTGEVRWRTKSLTDFAHYSSPVLISHSSGMQVVQLVEKKFFGVDPKSGEVLWTSGFPGKVAVIPTPIYKDGHVYVTAGYGVGCKLVKIAADGKSVTTVYEDNKVMKNHHGGVILVGDHLYGHSDGPGWVCQEFLTGKEVWASKALGKGAVHYADGMLYCIDEKSGDVALAEASPSGWNQSGRFKLSPLSEKRNRQGGIWPHPVVLNGRLYLRDQEYLYCYDVTGK